ncbi:MAG TPA: TA system VapC family ribonuclease toxin [Jatrophihabitantaceae bacterium]|nr:TA system VapC family ribonuclease toxin [Jatrophihabitantaceae bacterium]
MIVLDANVLFALFGGEHAHHARATAWFDGIRVEGETFGAPFIVWHALVRLATNRRVLDPPASHDEVFAFIDAMRGHDGHRPADAGSRHLELFRQLCERHQATGNLVTDAAIAAIAIENGATLASFDRDFARFRPALRWVIPGE